MTKVFPQKSFQSAQIIGVKKILLRSPWNIKNSQVFPPSILLASEEKEIGAIFIHEQMISMRECEYKSHDLSFKKASVLF